MALVGFARVSTQAQDLTSQVTKLEQAGCIKIIQGKHSGKAATNKQALEELLNYVREGDTVVVTKLDRLGRSLRQVLTTIEELTDKGVTLKTLDQNIDTSKDDPLNQAMVQLIGMFAELERNFIVTRTTEGKQLSGNYGGRKRKLTKEKQSVIIKEHADGLSISKLARAYNVSRATIGRILGTVPR